MQTKIHATLSVTAMLAACTPPLDCPAVVDRLRDDCDLQIGITWGSECRKSPSLLWAICELISPEGDEACLLTAECDEIRAGACAAGGDESAPTPSNCDSQCFSAVQRCNAECPPDEIDRTCDACLLACQAAHQRCLGDC